MKISAPEGHVLAATFTQPANAGSRTPVVITISGSGPQDRDEALPIVSGFRPFRQLADSLGRRGIAVLLMMIAALRNPLEGSTKRRAPILRMMFVQQSRGCARAVMWIRTAFSFSVIAREG